MTAMLGVPPSARYPERLRSSEQEALLQRRKAAGLSQDLDQDPAVGLALSGGGIRSATFSLGVLQGLAGLKLLKPFDYLSTVSGGGYVGSFLGALFCRDAAPGKPPQAAEVELGLAALVEPSAPAPKAIHKSVDWLRENGRYLTPGGSGDGFRAAAVVTRNFLAVNLVMALSLLLVFLAGDLLAQALNLTAGFHPLRLTQEWSLTPSPLWKLLPGAMVLLLSVGWSYWLIPTPAIPGDGGQIQHPALVALAYVPWAALVGWAWLQASSRPTLGSLLFLSSALGLLALVWYGLTPGKGRGITEHRRRNTLLLRGCFVGLVILAAYAAVDTLGWTLHRHWFPAPAGEGSRAASPAGPLEVLKALSRELASVRGALVAAAGALAALRSQVVELLPSRSKGEAWASRLLRGLGQTALFIVPILLVALGLAALSAMAHGIAFGSSAPSWHQAPVLVVDKTFLAFIAGLALLVLLLGRTVGFLNLSTLGPTYTSALTRTYPGASHAARREGNATPELLPGDDLPWSEYRPWEAGGPLHILNATLNETTGGRSQVLQKDRKGMNLAVGPMGLSVARQHHALWDAGRTGLLPIQTASYTVFGSAKALQPEALTVGQWVGISGAAFSTGLGSRTNLAFSLAAGFLNVRLGYWWWTGAGGEEGSVRRNLEALLPVQVHLLEEWTARFPGTHSARWYLSDGGHFENTAAYELLRRRLDFILLCDNGADEDRRLSDLSNLVAKARLDLGVEIHMLDAKGLADRFPAGVPAGIGTIDEVRDHAHPAHAAMANLDYLNEDGSLEKRGTLLLLKPTLSPGLPMDVAAYAESHKPFPQEPTTDQFFDEAQWESYRKLGEHTVRSLLRGKTGLHPTRWFQEGL